MRHTPGISIAPQRVTGKEGIAVTPERNATIVVADDSPPQLELLVLELARGAARVEVPDADKPRPPGRRARAVGRLKDRQRLGRRARAR